MKPLPVTPDLEAVARRIIGLRRRLRRSPTGIIGPRSWAYWNGGIGRDPAPPLPVRRIP